MSIDVWQKVTDAVIERLETGTVPWTRPWYVGRLGGPANVISKKAYRGINPFLLLGRPFDSPWWLTYRQAKSLGGHVRKGEKGSLVVFWKFLDKETVDDAGEKQRKRFPLLRYYTVFNVQQCAELNPARIPEDERPRHDWEKIQACEAIEPDYIPGPGLVHGGIRACYRALEDRVHMPERDRFPNREEYYSTLFHELTHSTGHGSRLDREGIKDLCAFGSTNYSKEELVAEMGAAMLCGHCGIENRTIDSSAAYIENWLGKLKGDKKLVVSAAAQAQKAVDLVLGRKWEDK